MCNIPDLPICMFSLPVLKNPVLNNVRLLFLFQPVNITKEIQRSLFVQNYKHEPKFHVHGQLGTKIAQEFGIDVSAIDSFTVSMDVGTVVKIEVG